MAFDPPRTTGWGESLRLAKSLAEDPSSRLGASLAGWAYPASRDYLALADVYDVLVAVNTPRGRRPKLYPRPWDNARGSTFGRTKRPQHEVLAALRARGHDV